MLRVINLFLTSYRQVSKKTRPEVLTMTRWPLFLPFFLSREVGWFFLSQEVGWFFFVLRGWVIVFCPKRLGDFFLSWEVGWFFSEIHNCEICGNVFISETLLKEHLTKSHIKVNIENALVDGTEDCKCVYPCIPIKPSVEAPVSRKKQLHCCLSDTPGCSFQCETQENF